MAGGRPTAQEKVIRVSPLLVGPQECRLRVCAGNKSHGGRHRARRSPRRFYFGSAPPQISHIQVVRSGFHAG